MGQILVVCAQPPYPIVDGARLRTYNTAKILQRNYGVHLVIADGVEAESRERLDDEFDDITTFDHDTMRHQLQQYGRIGQALLTRGAIRPQYYHFPDVQEWIDTHADEYDLMYANYVNTVPYVRSYRFIIDFVDSMSQNYEQLVARHSPPQSWLYRIESRRLRHYERAVAQEAEHGFVTAKQDADYIGVGDNISVLPNGVRGKYLERSNDNNRVDGRIVFLGRMNYHPNVDAVKYFVNEIFPQIRTKNPEATFYIVGSEPTNEVRSLAETPGVSVTGFVDEPAEYLESATVVVAPMRYGTGIQNKVLEAMALGRPVVTTPLGAEGIEAEDGTHLLVKEGSTEFAKAVADLLSNPGIGDDLGVRAQERIETRYTWDSISERLLGTISGILSN